MAGEGAHGALQIAYIDIRSLLLCLPGRLQQLLDQRFRLADAELLLQNDGGGLLHALRRFQRQQGPGVAGGELLLPQQRADGHRQIQKPQGVCHGGTGNAHPLGGLLLGQAQLLDQAAVALCLLHGV